MCLRLSEVRGGRHCQCPNDARVSRRLPDMTYSSWSLIEPREPGASAPGYSWSISHYKMGIGGEVWRHLDRLGQIDHGWILGSTVYFCLNCILLAVVSATTVCRQSFVSMHLCYASQKVCLYRQNVCRTGRQILCLFRHNLRLYRQAFWLPQISCGVGNSNIISPRLPLSGAFGHFDVNRSKQTKKSKDNKLIVHW